MASNTVRKIREAVSDGRLQQQFRPCQIARVTDIPKSTGSSFPAKHRVGNPGGYREYFERVAYGCYRLLNSD